MFKGHLDSKPTIFRYTISAVEDSVDLRTATSCGFILNPSWDDDLLSQQVASLISFFSLLRINGMPDLEYSIFPTPFYGYYNPDFTSRGIYSSFGIHVLVGRYDFDSDSVLGLRDGEVEVIWHLLGFAQPCERLHPELISLEIINWKFLLAKHADHIVKCTAIPKYGNWHHKFPGLKLTLPPGSYSHEFMHALASIPDFPNELVFSVTLQQPWRPRHLHPPSKPVEIVWIQFSNKSALDVQCPLWTSRSYPLLGFICKAELFFFCYSVLVSYST
jgi:hypothetical protein